MPPEKIEVLLDEDAVVGMPAEIVPLLVMLPVNTGYAADETMPVQTADETMPAISDAAAESCRCRHGSRRSMVLSLRTPEMPFDRDAAK